MKMTSPPVARHLLLARRARERRGEGHALFEAQTARLRVRLQPPEYLG
jgi:hypothetical protein